MVRIALQRVLRAMRLVAFEQLRHAIDLVQHLLEPELVDLVNDDEQHLVVLRPFRARLLQGEEFVDLQVGVVCGRSAA